jgi:hypothetical protein
MRSSVKIRLPFGTLKIATYLLLSSAEHDGKVPMRRIGRYYLVWRRSPAIPATAGANGSSGGGAADR